MKKKSLTLGIIAAILCTLYLTGCNPTDSTSSRATSSESVSVAPESVASTPVSEPAVSSEPTVPTIPAEDFVLLQQLVLADVNKALHGYADGTLPEPYRYETEPGNHCKAPQGVTLPTEAAWEDLRVDYPSAPEYTDFYDPDIYSTEAALPLSIGYELMIYNMYIAEPRPGNWR